MSVKIKWKMQWEVMQTHVFNGSVFEVTNGEVVDAVKQDKNY